MVGLSARADQPRAGGLERQTRPSDVEDRFRDGLRTFALASLLGTICTLIYASLPAVATAIAVGFFTLVVAHYLVDAKVQGTAPALWSRCSPCSARPSAYGSSRNSGPQRYTSVVLPAFCSSNNTPRTSPATMWLASALTTRSDERTRLPWASKSNETRLLNWF